jgi:parvulin-like peptidyl-prolyl isomerase
MRLAWVSEHRGQLVRSGVLRQVLRVELIEQALAEGQIPLLPPEDLQGLLQQFWQQQQLPPPKRAAWLAQRDLGEAELAAVVSRPQRWSQWCSQQWGQKLEALFLKHKNQLDGATASLLRLEEEGLARELYLQLAEDESSFAEIARTYCAEHPQRQGGQLGPKPLSELPPRLAEIIRSTPVGQLREPERLGPTDWVVLRVEAFTGSRVDDPAVQQRLLQLEGEAWLSQRIDTWLAQQPDGA